MNEPIFVLGCHRSGTSVVAGILHEACGVSMGELMPPTEDNPLGYFEALGVVDAHRDLLYQMERDWTCPPSSFMPSDLDLSALREQVDIHTELSGVWAMKDPRSMFLLPAWSHLGVGRARLVAVVRPPADTVRSIEKRDGIQQDRAEAIVEAHLQRLAEIAGQVPLPVIRFPGEGDSLIRQLRELAAALDLPWDEEAALELFDEKLVRNRSPLLNSSPGFDSLLERARYPDKVPATDLAELRLGSDPDRPLVTHLGVRHAQQRNELWAMSQFSVTPHPDVVELLLQGARTGGPARPGVELRQVTVNGPLAVGATMMRDRLRPDAVVAHRLLADQSLVEMQFFFRSLYVCTQPLAELLLDVPDPHGRGLLSATPAPVDHPPPARVKAIADQCGWDHIVTRRLSPGRAGMLFRKRVSTDQDLVPVVTDLIANLHRIHDIDSRLSLIEGQLEGEGIEVRSVSEQFGGTVSASAIHAERERADRAERDLERLRSRRSVRLAMALSRPFRPLFQTVRSWKKRS